MNRIEYMIEHLGEKRNGDDKAKSCKKQRPFETPGEKKTI